MSGDTSYYVAKSLGSVGIVDEDGPPIGMITDGDISAGTPALRDCSQKRQATSPDRTPKRSPLPCSLPEAVKLLNERKITSLVVVEDGHPVGLVHIHDFLKAGVI